MNNHVPNAQLWVGDHQALIAHAIEYLQNVLCSNRGCRACATCTLVAEQRHHATLWLAPEKQYTLASLEPVTRTLAFALEQETQFFIMIQKADALPVAAQNMLLKTVEEPPRGYHFIFLTEYKDALLPTIQSRCHIRVHHQKGGYQDKHASMVQLFTTTPEQALLAHADEIDKKNLSEQESTEILNAIITYWMKQYATANTPTVNKKLNFFLNAQQQPPMPGSSKLFWKNLLLQWHYSFTEEQTKK